MYMDHVFMLKDNVDFTSILPECIYRPWFGTQTNLWISNLENQQYTEWSVDHLNVNCERIRGSVVHVMEN